MHQVLFQIGSFKVYSYGATLVVAFLLALVVAVRQAKKEGVAEEHLLDFSLFLLIGGVLGARLLFVLLNLGDYLRHPLSILNLREGGLSLHGALAGGFLAALWFCRWKKLSLLKMLDLAAPSVILGIGIGRIGCFLNGCCYGTVTTLPWAVVFTSAHIPFGRHPAQLYELVLDLIVFVFLLLYSGRKKFEGELICLAVLLYSLVRFAVEFFREGNFYFLGLSLAQWASLLIAALCLAILLNGRKLAASAARSRKRR